MYKKMIMKARERGVSSEKAMWEGIDAVDELVESIKEAHPEKYWKFIRETHCSLFGPHYDCEFAENDVKNIHYTNKKGEECKGPHWTKEQVLTATKEMKFPSDVTDSDKYMAFNAMYADLCAEEDDETILRVAHRFYFMDEDAPKGKVWLYMNKMMYGY